MSQSISRAPNGFGWLSLLTAFALMVWAPVSAQAPRLTPGSGVVEAPIGPGGKSMTVWYYRPAGLQAQDHVLFVLHGVLRNADVYRDAWMKLAQEYRFLLLVPEFSRELFPTTDSYNFGNMATKDGADIPRDDWSFAVIDRAFALIAPTTPIKRPTYAIYGHSAGAQFVHRFMTYWSTERVEMAISANAGAYLLPIASEAYPYGLGGRPVSDAQMTQAFSHPFTLLLGEADIDPKHRFLPRAEAAMRQGDFRLARGKFYYETAKAEAARLGAPFAWKIATVPGVGHDNEKMAVAAVALLFDKPKD